MPFLAPCGLNGPGNRSGFQQTSAATTIPSSATVSVRTWGKAGLSLPNVYSVIKFDPIKTKNGGSPRSASLAREKSPGLPPQIVAARGSDS